MSKSSKKKPGKPMDPERIEFARVRILAQGAIGANHSIAKAIVEHFGCTNNTAHATVRRAYEELANEDAEYKPLRKFQVRQSLHQMIEKCFAAADRKGTTHPFGVALKCLQELSKIDGLYAPEQLEVVDRRRDVAEMTPEEQRNEIKELMAKRTAAGLPPIAGFERLVPGTGESN